MARLGGRQPPPRPSPTFWGSDTLPPCLVCLPSAWDLEGRTHIGGGREIPDGCSDGTRVHGGLASSPSSLPGRLPSPTRCLHASHQVCKLNLLPSQPGLFTSVPGVGVLWVLGREASPSHRSAPSPVIGVLLPLLPYCVPSTGKWPKVTLGPRCAWSTSSGTIFAVAQTTPPFGPVLIDE